MSELQGARGESIVGRSDELRQLTDFLRTARSNGGALLITGAPGIGKSTLLDAAGRLAGEETAVLRAAGDEAEAEVGFSALHQLLLPSREAITALNPRQRGALDSALGFADGPPPRRATLVAAVLDLLSSLDHGQGTLILLDDVQWLDGASGEVISAVAAHLAGTRNALLAAARSGEDVSLDVQGMPVLHLGPLSPAASAALLARRAPGLEPSMAERLLSVAAGIPLALLRLPVSADPRGDGEHPTTTDLPELFEARVAALPAGVRSLLLLLALDSSGTGRIALAAHNDGDRAADLRFASARDLIESDPEAGTLRFQHPLIRAAVVAASTGAERRTGHRRLALAERASSVRRAHHLAESVLGPDEAVAGAMEESADLELRQGDAAGAVAALLRAAELTSLPRERARRLAKAAYIGAEFVGELDRVAPLLRSARDGTSFPHNSLEAAIAASSLMLNGDGDVDAAHRVLVSGLQGAGTGASASTMVAEAMQALLMVTFFAGRPALWEAFDSSLKRHRSSVPRDLIVTAETFAAPLLASADSVASLAAAIKDLPQVSDPARTVRTAIAGFYLDRLADCRDALWAVVSADTERDATTPEIDAWILLAVLAYHEGRWAESERYASRGVEAADARGYALLAWPGKYCLALLASARGERSASVSLTDAMMQWAEPRGVRTVMAYAHHAVALDALGRSDYELAYRHSASVAGPGQLPPRFPHALWCARDLVEAALRTHRDDEARAHVAAMVAGAFGSLSPRHRMIQLACEGMVAEADGSEQFELALAVPGAERWPFELARVQLTYGESLRRARRPLRAREQLAAAVEGFALLGAAPWEARARSELAAASSRVASTRAGGLTLSPRETEVAELAATGLSNSEIAARLGISPRTVATHSSRALLKLGLQSRAGLREALDSDG